jgi:hypothetical protein
LILSIDPATGRVHRVGRLPRALSDVTAVAIGNSVLVAGGRTATAAQAELGSVTILAGGRR